MPKHFIQKQPLLLLIVVVKYFVVVIAENSKTTFVTVNLIKKMQVDI